MEVSTAARVAEKLAQGEVHLGFLYSPPRLADLLLREVGRVELVLVSSRAEQVADEALAVGYVFVDWGTAFVNQHNRRFPHRPLAAARSNSGRVALDLIRECGGSAYLPRSLVESYLGSGVLYRVGSAPVFEMQVYAAYLAHGEQRDLIEQVLGYF